MDIDIEKLSESIEMDAFGDKNVNTIEVWLGVDSEFQTRIDQNNQFITVQINDRIYEHPSLGENKLPTWRCESAISHHLGLKDKVYTEKYPTKEDPKLIAHIGMFFSPSDIVALFRTDLIQRQVMEKLKQTRRITSGKDFGKQAFTGLVVYTKNNPVFYRYLYIQIHDICAFFQKMSLEKLAATLNVPFEEKEIFSSKDKKNMLEMYRTRFDDFSKYATGDSLVIKKLVIAHKEMWKNVCRELEIESFDPAYTPGINTSKVIERMIIKNLGYIDQKEKKDLLKHIKDLNKDARSKYLAQDKDFSSQELSLVDGGRCKNERPTDTNAKGFLVDIDISGCYGNSSFYQTYPIGLPVILKYSKNEKAKRMTLGEFLKSKIFKDIIPGLWFARISTEKS